MNYQMIPKVLIMKVLVKWQIASKLISGEEVFIFHGPQNTKNSTIL